MTELRFSSPGWKFYSQGLTVSALGIVLVVWGVVIIAVDPWNWVGVISMLGGGMSAAAGLALLLFVWFIYVYGIFTSWRKWRQFRPPTVAVDADGVRYQAPRRPVTVPWADIEQVMVDRIIFPRRVVTKVALRLTPGAALIRDGVIQVPASRYLNVGLMSDLDVPEDVAQEFLSDTAGPRLEIKEDDRRPEYAARGYR